MPTGVVLVVAGMLAVTGCAGAVDGQATSNAPAAGTSVGTDDRVPILQAAQRFSVEFSHLDPAGVDAHVAAIQGQTTGKLGALYSAPNALENSRKSAALTPISSSAVVQTVALESAESDVAKVLISSVSTTNLPVIPGVISKAETQRSLDRVRVTVEHKDGKYLISDLEEWSTGSKNAPPPTLPAGAGAGADAPVRDAALHYLQSGFTFTPATFEADRAEGRALLTTNAQAAYDAATKNDQSDVQYGGRSTTATPLAAGTVSIDGAKATVLGFLDTSSTFAKGAITTPGPAQPSTALIELIQTDGHWLVDSYTEVKRPG